MGPQIGGIGREMTHIGRTTTPLLTPSMTTMLLFMKRKSFITHFVS
jgi:hypothetical protein